MTRPAVQFQLEETVMVTLSLHEAVLLGNVQSVQDALDAGADVNACDRAGRTVLCCALLGHDGDSLSSPTLTPSEEEVETRFQILNHILAHPDLSLYSLNHPLEFANGVTPLGLACWSNKVPDCTALLQTGVCAVDAMDLHGATPLMYAARDGYADVVAQLLSYAARPDLLDSNHRSAIQHAIKHPQIVWLCENHLRRQRDLKSSKYSSSRFLASSSSEPDLSISSNSDFSSRALLATTECVIQMIQCNNIESLHTLLFPSPFPESIYVSPDQPLPSLASFSRPPVVLINHRDASGYAPIHHAMMVPHPSTECVDALYRAGADMALVSADTSTPLHILARYSRDSAFDHPAIPTTDAASKLLYSLTTHLIKDLKAPLAACDGDLETCIHIAAEHGESEQVLAALLDCDSNGVVRAMCNDRGLRPLDVAKPEFIPVFYKIMERPTTSTSSHTIVPKSSTASISTISSKTSIASITTLGHHLFDIDPMLTPDFPTSRLSVVQLTSDIFDNLERCSIALRGDPDHVPLADMSSLLKRTRDTADIVLGYWKAKINESYEGFKGTNKDFMQTEKLLTRVNRVVDKLEAQRHSPIATSTKVPMFARTIPRRGSVPLPSTPSKVPRKIASAPCSPASHSRAPSLSIHLPPQSFNLQEELEAVLKQRSDLFGDSPSHIFRISQPDAPQDSQAEAVGQPQDDVPPNLSLSRRESASKWSTDDDWLEKFVLHNESTAWQVRQANLEEMDLDIEMLMTKIELLSTKINDVSLYGSINPRSIQTMRSLLCDRQETQAKLQKVQDERYFLQWCIKGLADIGQEMNDSTQFSAWLNKTIEQPEKARLQLDCLWDEEEGGDQFGDRILDFSAVAPTHQERDLDNKPRQVPEEKPLPRPPTPSVVPSRQSLLLATAEPLFGRIRMDLRDIDGRITSADQLVGLTRHSITQAQEFLDQAIKSRADKVHAIWMSRMNMAGTSSSGTTLESSPQQMSFPHSPSSSTTSSRSSLSLSAMASGSSIASSPSNSPPPTQSKFSFTSVLSRIRTKSHTSFAQVQAAFSSQTSVSHVHHHQAPQPQPQQQTAMSPTLAPAFDYEPVDDDLGALRRLLGQKISECVDSVNENVEIVDSWMRIVREVLRHYKRRVTAVC